MYPTTDDKRSDIIECARAVLINEACSGTLILAT